MVIRAYVYARMLGCGRGMRRTSEMAVLNANYIASRLDGTFDRPKSAQPMHEMVFSASRQKKASGVSALDIAKRLIDYGHHPPTIYFPLPRVTPEAMLIEPTETESLEQIDEFVEAMIRIADEAERNPRTVAQRPAPHARSAAGRSNGRAEARAACGKGRVALYLPAAPKRQRAATAVAARCPFCIHQQFNLSLLTSCR